MGQFSQRITELIDRVGDGPLVGIVEVDQVYAKYQHEDLSLRHFGGGGPKYLERPLFEDHTEYLTGLADKVLEGELVQEMAQAMEDLSGSVYDEAPFEFGDLKASGHPMVEDNGTVVYDRAPLAHRLSEEEIDIKERLREIGLGNQEGIDGWSGA